MTTYLAIRGNSWPDLSRTSLLMTLNKQSKLTKPPDDKPWLPFSSWEEFDFAELVHDAALNQKQINTLIKLIGRCQEVPGAFTFRNYSDLKRSLDEASKLLTRVSTFSDLSRTNYLSPVGATLPLTIPSVIARAKSVARLYPHKGYGSSLAAMFFQ